MSIRQDNDIFRFLERHAVARGCPETIANALVLEVLDRYACAPDKAETWVKILDEVETRAEDQARLVGSGDGDPR